VYSFTPQQDSLRLENRGKVLASLERLGKTPVIPLLGPWHVEPGNVFKFAEPPELEDRGTNISAKGMADTAGQYHHKSTAASKCQNSRQYHCVVPRHYRGIPHQTPRRCRNPSTIGEFPLGRLGGTIGEFPIGRQHTTTRYATTTECAWHLTLVSAE